MINDRLAHALLFPRDTRATVYFVQCEQFTKIGITQDLVKRFDTLKVNNPFVLKLLASFKSSNPKGDEELLHALFESYHVRGEWFKLPLKVLRYIENTPISAQLIVDEFITMRFGN